MIRIALTTLAACALAACSGSQAGKTFTGTFSACAKANLAQLVGGTAGKTLLDDVRDEIVGNSATLSTDLDGLALTVGLDAVECAVAAVIAVLSPPPAQGSGALVTSSEPPGVTRAKAWLAANAASRGGTP